MFIFALFADFFKISDDARRRVNAGRDLVERIVDEGRGVLLKMSLFTEIIISIYLQIHKYFQFVCEPCSE